MSLHIDHKIVRFIILIIQITTSRKQLLKPQFNISSLLFIAINYEFS